ncbi:MAG: ABC transporter permease subunit [Anaerolineales bacterium]|nr:ABC transporter permease subunit [Anaerolineales bacterium]
MKPFSSLNRIFSNIPIHAALILLCLLWIVPTLGLFVTSFRPREDVRTSGWWTVFQPRQVVGETEYDTYCASCHGADGKEISAADLSSPELLVDYPRSNRLLTALRKDIDGKPHLSDPALPSNPNKALDTLSKILDYMRSLSSGGTAKERFTLRNYADALVGYKGTQDYLTDCQQGVASALAKFQCNSSDLLNPEGMGRALLNTIMVAVPATILPILLAAFAAYAFTWMDFKGRQLLFIILVGLQIVPLQMTLVPIARLYAQLGMQSTFYGIWLFHTAFGLPYAIFLMSNFLRGLPRELFESAYIDGANHWISFWNMALPLALPAIAALGIFQFLWLWNDFLVAKIFLTTQPVLTVQITNLIDPRGVTGTFSPAQLFFRSLSPCWCSLPSSVTLCAV